MNIIVIIADTYRYDNLFDRAGNHPNGMTVRTPALDKFSERAVSLSRLYTASFPTIPHRTDFTTGRYGWPWYPWQDRRLSSANHAPDMLREAGYVSQLLGDCPHLFPAHFNQGFDAAYALRGQEGDLSFLRMNRRIEQTMPPEKTRFERNKFQKRNLPDLHRWTNSHWRTEMDTFPPRTAGLAVEWLEENYQYHPFFLWVDFFDPHEPWDPPEYMVNRYDPAYTGTPMIHPNYGMASSLSADEQRNLRAHYCAEAELVDRWVGRIFQKIDVLALWDNSIVVFMSDHGMCLGEHNRTGKSNISEGDERWWPLYPEIAHIPFMVAAPGLEGGRTVDAIIQPPDILPTLLELAGVDVTPSDPFHGKSFAAALRGDDSPPLHKFAITAKYVRNNDEGELPRYVMTPMLYTTEWAYTPVGSSLDGAPELYAIADDYYAEQNVIDQYPQIADGLHNKFLGWMRAMGAPEDAIAVYA
ncbi:MAG: sulfatase [Chloroflexota bacterium]